MFHTLYTKIMKINTLKFFKNRARRKNTFPFQFYQSKIIDMSIVRSIDSSNGKASTQRNMIRTVNLIVSI